MKGKATFECLLTLHRSIENDLVKLGRRAENARKLMMHLYRSPVISVKQVEELLNLKYVPANSLVSSLVDMNILEETTGYSRNRLFLFRRYIDTFSD